MLAGLVASADAVRAAELAIEPLAPTVAHCDEIVLELALRDLAVPVDLSGYQLFLRYPAAALRPLRFEPTAIRATVYTAGPAPFGAGFAACSTWSDGAETDVVAIGATVYPDSDEGEVETLAATPRIVLGRLTFELRATVAGSVDVFFALNETSCRDVFDETTAVFDGAGVPIALDTPEEIVVTIVHGGEPVGDLSCAVAGDDAVDLAWTLPLGFSAQSIRVRRDDETIATLDATATSHRDAAFGGRDRAVYRVTPIVASGAEGCAATCVAVRPVAEVPFRRGDVNFDGRRNISDAVAILRSIASGEVLSCPDAGDVDDDGRVVVTDAIFELDFLFNSGPVLAPPLTEPGLDPTPDALPPCAAPAV